MLYENIYNNVTSYPEKENLLIRPRINQILKKAMECPVVTVTAGTGFGKTQAVASFLKEERLPAVWIQLSKLDNYPTRFWEIFTYGLADENTDPAFVEGMEQLGFPDSLQKIDQFLHLFSQELYKLDGLVIVLDDVDNIEDERIKDFIERFIMAHLENLTFVLISKWPFDIDYAKEYDTNVYASITTDQLRFTPEETQEYLSMVGIALRPAELTNLQTATEGWPLAIYLIGLHYQQGKIDLQSPVAYSIPALESLIEREVFSNFSTEMQKLYIRFSLLESIPFGIVEEMAGEHLQEWMESVEQNMLVHYNRQQGMFKYHHMFYLFLQPKQFLLSGEEKRDVYQSVARWYEEHNRKVDALNYYTLSCDYEKMWSIIVEYGKQGYDEEIGQLFVDLIGQFPQEFIQTHPRVRAFYAQLHLVLLDIEKAYDLSMELIEEWEGKQEYKEALGEVYIGMAHISIFQKSFAFAEYYRKARECLPSGSYWLSSKHFYVVNNNAMYLFTGKAGEADKILSIIFEVMPIATEVMNGCGYGFEFLAAAELAYFRGDFKEAVKMAYQAIYKATEKGQYDIISSSYFVLLRVYLCKGNYDKCMEYLDELKEFISSMQSYDFLSAWENISGYFYGHIGCTDLVPKWIVDSVAFRENVRVPMKVNREQLIKAFVLLERREYFELFALLEKLDDMFGARNHYFPQMQAKIMKAVCLYRMGEMEEAISQLKEAYDMSHPNGLIIHYVELGNDMRVFIDAIRNSDDTTFEKEWLDQVYIKASTMGKRKAFLKAEYEKHHNLTDEKRIKLTGREKEILDSLCQGLTREEMADSHDISMNTVKSTLRNIFSKLGAINRADAIRIATETNILDS